MEDQEQVKIIDILRSDPSWEEEIINYRKMIGSTNPLMTNTLINEKRIFNPLKFLNLNKSECIIILYLGEDLCSYKTIIHGGILATLLEEQASQIYLSKFPLEPIFTSNLNINYLKPVECNKYYLLYSFIEKIDRYKIYIKANIESLDRKNIFVKSNNFIVNYKLLKEHKL